MENLDILGCPKVQDLPKTAKKSESDRITLSDTRPHFTLQNESLNCSTTGRCSIWRCKFCIVNCIVSNYEIESFKKIQSFFSENKTVEIQPTRQMTDHEDTINLSETVFDDNNQERKSLSCSGQTYSKSLIAILIPLLSICWIFQFAFGELIFKKLEIHQLFGCIFCVVQHGIIYPQQDYEQVSFYRKLSLDVLVRSVRDKKIKVFFTAGSKLGLLN